VSSKVFTAVLLGLVGSLGVGSLAYTASLSSIPASAGEQTAIPLVKSVDDLVSERDRALSSKRDAIEVTGQQALVDGRTSAISSEVAAIGTEADRIKNLSTFFWPTAGSVSKSNGYGMRYHPILHYYRMHDGMDIGGKCGAPIYAAQSGKVVKAEGDGYHSGSGKNVRIDHGDINGTNVETSYLHMSDIGVKVGDDVNKGDLIGNVGDTGLATGCHLHLALYKNGKGSDPAEYVKKVAAEAASSAEPEGSDIPQD
jgi:murein DD-endopeptidase MepM/ murein hydrolase activator NlpD